MIIKSSVKPGGSRKMKLLGHALDKFQKKKKRVMSSVQGGGFCGLDGANLGVKSEHCDLIANLILSNMGPFLGWPSPEYSPSRWN